MPGPDLPVDDVVNETGKDRSILEESQEASSNKCVALSGAEGEAGAAGVREAGVPWVCGDGCIRG